MDGSTQPRAKLLVLEKKCCWLVADGRFVLREKYCWLVADKPNEQGVAHLSLWQRSEPAGGALDHADDDTLWQHKTSRGLCSFLP
jgi:hypothetical protein